MLVWMAKVKTSDSFLLSLSNENENFIPELSTAMPTLPNLQLVLQYICQLFCLFIFPIRFCSRFCIFSPPQNQLEVESYRKPQTQLFLPVQIFHQCNKPNRNYAHQRAQPPPQIITGCIQQLYNSYMGWTLKIYLSPHTLRDYSCSIQVTLITE